ERPPNQVRYPAAGTANAAVELELVSLDGAFTTIDWSDGGRFEYLADVVWQPGHHPLIVRQTRDQRLVSIAELPLGEVGGDGLPKADEVGELYTITDDIWVELQPGAPRWCSAGLLTIEDRDGARRLVLGGEPLSDTRLNVRSIVGVRHDSADEPGAESDEAGASSDAAVVVSAWTEPTEIHLFELPLPGSGLAESQLTVAPGVHAGALGAATLAITSSVPDRPGSQVTVADLSPTEGGRAAAIIDRSAEPGFAAAPEFCALGTDNLEAALFLPTDHDGSTPLPVLVDPYGGPHAQRVLKTHNPHLVSRWFAENSYAVLVTDGRGTPGRGPAWERAVWGDLAGPVLDDQLAALDAVIDRYHFLDASRVAIRGWSFGGYLAALAVLRRPDRFHAAIAGAPVTTWRLYDTHYTERYLGHPSVFPEHYDRSDLWVENEDGPQLERLERPLLLIHGLADDNVVSAHTLRFSTALLATGSPHRVLPLSGVTHMTPQEAVAENLLRLQLDFLDETIGRGEL
ncbi:MAG: prolyl oligopeptidase family serine peptidase, partial [Acidimicrobiia bacterium]|nr:prolyl oligopeptidase family serine peptidase [Acidimicrobiia bacterium]